MYEVYQREKELYDGTVIPTFETEITSCNIIDVEAGTTGYKGGDTGHGGRTYFRIQNAASTDIAVNTFGDNDGNEGFEVTLGGDCELETIIEALQFILQVFKDATKRQ